MFIFDIMQLEISYFHYSTEGEKNIEVSMDGHWWNVIMNGHRRKCIMSKALAGFIIS